MSNAQKTDQNPKPDVPKNGLIGFVTGNYAIPDEKGAYILQFPANKTIYEVYDKIVQLKNEVWEIIKKREEEEKQKESKKEETS